MKRLALDTNLYVLLLVGSAAPRQIARHKRLSAFDVKDFNRLVELTERTRELVTIPQAIAEVANLAVQGIVDPLRTEILIRLKTFVGEAHEVAVPSRTAVGQKEYTRLGVTDSAWLAAIVPDTVFVTTDESLFVAATQRNIDAVLFSRVRR